MKEFFYNKPYGKAKFFKQKIDKADFEKLSKLIKIVGLLLQIKVYLFWKKQSIIISEAANLTSNAITKLHPSK